MPVLLQTTLLLICSNVFMTFALLYMKQPLKLTYCGQPCVSAVRSPSCFARRECRGILHPAHQMIAKATASS